MSYDGAQLLRLRLRRDKCAPGRAREALAELPALNGCEDALLVVSELATNAVLRAGADADGEFELLAELIPDGIRIAVTDDGRAGGAGGATPAAAIGSTSAAAPTSSPGLSGGMGLWVVDALSRRWGTERDDITRVWAELAL